MKDLDKRTLKFIRKNDLEIVDVNSKVVSSDKELIYIFNNKNELREFFDNNNCSDAKDDTIALCVIGFSKDKRLLVSKGMCDQVLSFYERRGKTLKLIK